MAGHKQDHSGERTIEFDEPIMDEQSTALQNAIERAERAEAELAKLKSGAAHTPSASHNSSHTAGSSHSTATAGTHASSASHSTAKTSRDADKKEKPEHSVKHDSTEKSEHTEAHGTKGHAKTSAAVSSDDVDAIAPRDTSSTARPDPSGKHLVEPGSMDARKQPAAQSPEGHAVGEPEARGVEALRDDSMMAHLLDSLEAGKDIGHYGRLTFTMIARHFLSDDEVLAELTKDRDFSEEQARQMLMQVEGRDYSPPRRERILQWQAEQEFPIIPDRHDPDCGNTYKTLRYPKQTYDHIGHYQEEKTSH